MSEALPETSASLTPSLVKGVPLVGSVRVKGEGFVDILHSQVPRGQPLRSGEGGGLTFLTEDAKEE